MVRSLNAGAAAAADRALEAVLDEIARAALVDARDDAVTLGTITLRAHQREALRRLRAGIARAGGALLADEPGLGKTFVALALAREHPAATIVAPAALRPMWREAAGAAGVGATFVSLETLSRRDPDVPLGGLVIVDEAHHVCNPATARYGRLARLTRGRRVLLLSGTPVRNRRAELDALLALFLGPRARRLDDAARARCIVRRRGDASLLPAIDGPHWHRVHATPGILGMIESLPPPLPALDGTRAGALLRMTLARCWASSVAALDAALRRRLQRGAAFEALLDAGRLPTRAELRAWVVGDDAVQLAFPMLVVHETSDAAALRAMLDVHLAAVRALRARTAPQVHRDAEARARTLLDLRAAHPGARIVAFAAHAATAEALYRELAREGGVAILTSRGARTAGGARPRADVIESLSGGREGADAHAREIRCRTEIARDDISLVIATDLLSEGVNLQGASVIVHLDVPWTPAGLDQRVGRAARIGSPHACVHVHGFSPPAASERLVGLARRLRRKHAEQAEAARVPREIEALRAVVRTWRREPRLDAVKVGSGDAPVASVVAPGPGFIAVVEERGQAALACGRLLAGGRWRISDEPRALCSLARGVRVAAGDLDRALEATARAALSHWLDGRRARDVAGAGALPSRARRALLGRIDAALRAAGPHSRAALSARIASVRGAVDRAIGAGAERTLEELSRTDGTDLDRLLAACETNLAGCGAAQRPVPGPEIGAPGAPGAPAPPAIRALLLLRGSP